jgi:1-phosphofructokinase family hexose kinase
MILIVTPNPALDKTAEISDLRPGGTYRFTQLRVQSGGKGFNVARSLRRLGQLPLVVGPLAGHAGQYLAELASAEGLPFDGVPVRGETRSCLVLAQPALGLATELYEVGDRIDASEWQLISERVAARLSDAQMLAVCGSFPVGVTDTALQDLVNLGNAQQVPTFVDTHGPALATAIASRTNVVKINQDEAAELTGQEIKSPAEAVGAARWIQQQGAAKVVITLGQYGAIGLDTAGQCFGWQPPPTEGRYPVGSGDAMLAGIISATGDGQGFADAVRLGVAVGTANSLQPGAGIFNVTDVSALLPQVTEINLGNQ